MPFYRSNIQAAPAGKITHFAGATAPAGWLACNGATISRATYAALFAAIGTTYGAGDGATTFALPDLRGEFVRGLDSGRGVDAGRALGSAQAHQFPQHTHGYTGTYTPNAGNAQSTAGDALSLGQSEQSTGAAGGTSNASETRPRNVAMLACIKY